MRVYISVDMEGIGGITHPHPTDPANARYPASVELMVAETNAAIEGALAAGASDVLVNDSHWNMYNLLPEDLHPFYMYLRETFGPFELPDARSVHYFPLTTTARKLRFETLKSNGGNTGASEIEVYAQ